MRFNLTVQPAAVSSLGPKHQRSYNSVLAEQLHAAVRGFSLDAAPPAYPLKPSETAFGHNLTLIRSLPGLKQSSSDKTNQRTMVAIGFAKTPRLRPDPAKATGIT